MKPHHPFACIGCLQDFCWEGFCGDPAAFEGFRDSVLPEMRGSLEGLTALQASVPHLGWIADSLRFSIAVLEDGFPGSVEEALDAFYAAVAVDQTFVEAL